MKIFLCIALIFVAVVLALASSNVWRSGVRPALSLVDAVNLATETLNKNGGDFYCLGASVYQWGAQCDWELTFGSTNGTMRWADVTGDKRIEVHTTGPNAHHK